MRWGKVFLGGIVGGIVMWLVDFVQHGVIMADTYMSYPEVFNQAENPNAPWWFLLVEVCIAIAAAMLFVKTRGSWAAGVSGGLTFGFFLGLVGFFPNFFHPLTIDGFPYYLAWCWGGMTMIASLVLGAVLGLIVKA
ncbi:MAG: hypothetical protein R2991_08395 [Thermoanaerobaculia bacterium]